MGHTGFCVPDCQFSPGYYSSFHYPNDQPKSGAALMEPIRKVGGQRERRGVSEDTTFSRAALSGARRQQLWCPEKVCDCVIPGLPGG